MRIDPVLLQHTYEQYRITPYKKIRLDNPTTWQHHCGGWTSVIDLLYTHLHSADGILFISAVEETFSNGHVIKEPWTGFVHQVPRSGIKWYLDLERLVRDPAWKASLPYCKGLFTLSTYVKNYLEAASLPCPVVRVFYPIEDVPQKFSFDSFSQKENYSLIGVGEFLRNHQALFDLPCGPYTKSLLKPENFNIADYSKTETVDIIDRLTNEQYASLLSSSLVFLNLRDAPANTTIIECIVRNTPVLVNKLPGVVEYLGEEYPFYYDTLEEAAAKASNLPLIKETVDYLQHTTIKDLLQPEVFLAHIQNSSIYRSLPVPNGQSAQFRQFNVSVMICSYNRVSNIPNILQRLLEQDYNGDFEVIIWNNNELKRDELEEACASFKNKLHLTIIHSSQNFYCIVRLSAASLIRSELLLICDDDVIPNSNYVSTFMEKHAEYGAESVLCCRGHRFLPHTLNEESPQLFWQDYQHMSFYDESIEDRQIHFFHADNCLIPKAILKKAAVYEMEQPEFALVDDYWLSYIVSHKLNVPIWKFRSDHIFGFTESANDPSVALFLNPKVEEQRVNFYIHHMRNGWPYAAQPTDQHKINGFASVQRATAEAIWNKGFHGVNMYSEADDKVFAAAAQAGIKVVRFGAIEDARDLSYLVNEERTKSNINSETIKRLKRSIHRANDHGLSVIITLTHLPGRNFKPPDGVPDTRIWENEEYQQELITMWGEIARALADCSNVIGYDLMNEPVLPEEVPCSDFDESPQDQLALLNGLYKKIIDEIRIYDQKTMIVLEASFWAKPEALTSLEPVTDPLVAYSFHMYSPDILSNRAKNRGRFSYPGLVPTHSNFNRWVESEYWDKQVILKKLQYIADWQYDNRVPSSRIYVGEFGISRETRGSLEYLRDIMDICEQFQWSWTIYSFREEAWDAMNYELGNDISNALNETDNPLYHEISKRFK